MTAHALDYIRPLIDGAPLGPSIPNLAERLEAFAAMIPGPLPEDYLETLTGLGGQAVLLRDNEIPRAPDRPFGGNVISVEVLFGLGDHPSSLVSSWEDLSPRLPRGLVPIGADSIDNQICVETGLGRIFFWEMNADPGPDDGHYPGWRNTHLVADSFTEFCSRLQLSTDDAVPLRGAFVCRIPSRP